MLEYKCAHAGVVFEVINEAYTTVTCSVCKKRTGLKGQEDLRIREWRCVECGITHDRDINAATNILALGHERLAEGTSLCGGPKGRRSRIIPVLSAQAGQPSAECGEDVNDSTESLFDEFAKLLLTDKFNISTIVGLRRP